MAQDCSAAVFEVDSVLAWSQIGDEPSGSRRGLTDAHRDDTRDIPTIHARVLALSGIYGELDGENNYNYATVFAQVYRSMTADQKTKLATLHTSILTGSYADGTPFDFFLYSGTITNTSVLSPYIADTDYLFFAP
ncbi:MAG: hypothetical protein WCI05_03320 [Myxococcales bacterium]